MFSTDDIKMKFPLLIYYALVSGSFIHVVSSSSFFSFSFTITKTSKKTYAKCSQNAKSFTKKKEEQKTKFFKGCLGVEEEKGNIHSLSLWST